MLSPCKNSVLVWGVGNPVPPQTDLVQVRVSGDVVAPLLGRDAPFGLASRMAEPGRLHRRPRCPVRATRGAGQQPEPARCRRAPTQPQRGSSWESVHAACGHSTWGNRAK